MSVRASTWAWDQIEAGNVPTAGARLVLLAFADHADDRGICWPGRERVAAKTGLDERTVIRATDTLVEKDLVKVEHRHDTAGRNLSHRYHLNLGRVTNCHPRVAESQPVVTFEQPPPASTQSNHQKISTYQKTTTTNPPLEAAGSGGVSIVFEKAIQHFADRLPGWLAGVDSDTAQMIADELAGALEAVKAGKRLKIASPRDWTKKLVLAAKRGEFEPDLALAVQRRRQRLEQQQDLQQEAERVHTATVGSVASSKAGTEAIEQLKQKFGIRGAS